MNIVWQKEVGYHLQDLHVIVWTDITQLSLFSSVKEGERKDTISHEDRDISLLLSTLEVLVRFRSRIRFAYYLLTLPVILHKATINTSSKKLQLFLFFFHCCLPITPIMFWLFHSSQLSSLISLLLLIKYCLSFINMGWMLETQCKTLHTYY